MIEDCLFCKIIAKQIPTEVIYEDDEFFVMPDKFPKAPVHILILPKEHITSIAHTEDGHGEVLGKMLLLGRKIAKDKGIEDFRLLLNSGKYAEIGHLHLHLISGHISWGD